MFSSEKKGMRHCNEVVGLLVVAVDDGDREREVVVIVAVVTVVIALHPLYLHIPTHKGFVICYHCTYFHRPTCS